MFDDAFHISRKGSLCLIGKRNPAVLTRYVLLIILITFILSCTYADEPCLPRVHRNASRISLADCIGDNLCGY